MTIFITKGQAVHPDMVPRVAEVMATEPGAVVPRCDGMGETEVIDEFLRKTGFVVGVARDRLAEKLNPSEKIGNRWSFRGFSNGCDILDEIVINVTDSYALPRPGFDNGYVKPGQAQSVKDSPEPDDMDDWCREYLNAMMV